jgi:hypothetical protein
MTVLSQIRCDGCGEPIEDDVLSPQELRDAVQSERGWVQCRGFDFCTSEECADRVAVLAGMR